MTNRQLLGILGSAILFIGVFMPIVKLPVVGEMNYFHNGRGDGVIVLALAVTSFVLVLIWWYRQIWITSLGSAAVLAFTFFNFQSKMSQATRQMETELKDNPFRGLADLAVQSVQLQWGWAVLVIGIVLLIAVAAMKDTADDWSR
jgi:Ca2+/Na+ antiporter